MPNYAIVAFLPMKLRQYIDSTSTFAVKQLYCLSLLKYLIFFHKKKTTQILYLKIRTDNYYDRYSQQTDCCFLFGFCQMESILMSEIQVDTCRILLEKCRKKWRIERLSACIPFTN